MLLFCFSLVDQTGRGQLIFEKLCNEQGQMSHEQFLCVPVQAKKKATNLTKDQILSDAEMRVSQEFKISNKIKDRVGFWFDIYTVYGANQKVIHHSDFPWLVFKVLDFNQIMSRPKARWVNQTKVDLLTKFELNKTRLQISGLVKKSKNKRFNRAILSEDEKIIVDHLLTLPGSLTSNLIRAQHNVRVQTGQRDFYLNGLKESRDYLKTMENVFLEYRLPIELARLPMVESSFNMKATSKAGAAGVWQFMPSTGKKFLVINDYIDERRSAFKSTAAAAILLKENYLLFQNWGLALTAYNHGPGGLRLAIKKAKTRDLEEIITKYESKNFNFAGQNYYSEFLAALYAQKYSKEVFGNFNSESRLEYEKVKLTTVLKPSLILSWLDLSVSDFTKMNPDLRSAIKSNIALPVGFDLYFTPDMAFEFRTLQTKYKEELKRSLKSRRVADFSVNRK